MALWRWRVFCICRSHLFSLLRSVGGASFFGGYCCAGDRFGDSLLALVSSSSTQGPKILRPSVTAPDANTIFADAPEDSAYYVGIRWAVRTSRRWSRFEGHGAEDPVTRGELITMFYKLAGSPAVDFVRSIRRMRMLMNLT